MKKLVIIFGLILLTVVYGQSSGGISILDYANQVVYVSKSERQAWDNGDFFEGFCIVGSGKFTKSPQLRFGLGSFNGKYYFTVVVTYPDGYHPVALGSMSQFVDYETVLNGNVGLILIPFKETDIKIYGGVWVVKYVEGISLIDFSQTSFMSDLYKCGRKIGILK